ncbi:MAG: Pyrophosphatase PpaX [Planctomycetes bacterium ADurb.Bin401]|nr:MAG: Pyrophosphatase PpaX [Planctomycetes bacterium ADurb.Bin401]
MSIPRDSLVTLPMCKDKLGEMQIPVGILTRNTRRNAAAVAQKHNLKFDAIFDRSDGPVKPHPCGVEKLCSHFNVLPAETMVVGDYLFDLQCAKAAGAIAVLMKNSEKSLLFSEYADFTIDNLTQLIDIINRT